MSKIGKKPIIIPEGLSVNLTSDILEFKKGDEAVNLTILPFVKAEFSQEDTEDGKSVKTLVFSIESEEKQAKANWGTIRSLAQNIIDGLMTGFKKVLEIEGIGYRAAMEGENLVLNVGFSHPVKFIPPQGIKIAVEKNQISVTGTDKALVGETAAKIRKIKKPEPYKGKGIRYQGEIIKRKVGKKTGAK